MTSQHTDDGVFDLPSVARQALSTYAAHPLQFVLISLLGLPLYVSLRELEEPLLFYLWLIPSILLGEVVIAALTHATGSALAGSPPSLASYRVAIGRLAPLLELLIRYLGAFLLLVITIAGIPLAIRVLVRWFFGIQGVILNDLDAKQAISLSCQVVTGRWWKLAGTMCFAWLVFASPGLGAWAIWGESTLRYVIVGVASVLVQPFLAAFWTLLFLRLERAHAGD